MIEIVAYFYPEHDSPNNKIVKVTTLEEYFEELRGLCEQYSKILQRTYVQIFSRNGDGLIITLNGFLRKHYSIKEGYEEYEPIIKEICKEYFDDAKERNKVIVNSVEDLNNVDIEIRGYAIPQDYDYGPIYGKKCKFGEAGEILKYVISTWPEEDHNLQFFVWTREEEYLFCIRRDLETIHLNKNNVFNLTKEKIKEALGI